MNEDENPARIIYSSLCQYMSGNVVYIGLDFNFEDGKNIASYNRCLDAAIDQFENGVLKEWVPSIINGFSPPLIFLLPTASNVLVSFFTTIPHQIRAIYM